MNLQPENLINIIHDPGEYFIAFVVFAIFILVTFCVTKSNGKNAHR